ncbi:DUF4232 domain-containing protein [Nocardia stercoris]|uniref:DUF4232 domain-containing protein n=1 Tax=Nocardia stercoris TaxID=2483361 RepID=A0A3M2LA88_9NOCA|nr:DUF4232 domain-containing protein [Nocardia stercoris]RMI33473.1 DUF4232 domain-containing protein [Nocardia stercoris]
MKRYSIAGGLLAAATLTLTGCNSTLTSGPVTVTVSAPDSATPGTPGGANPGPGGANPAPARPGGSPNSGAPTDNQGSDNGSPGGAPNPGAPAPGKCTTSQLTLDKGVGGLQGGHWFLRLINHSANSCVLQGFPGVSYTNGPTGDPVGQPADREQTATPAPVTVAPNAAAQFEFIENDSLLEGCAAVHTDTIRVYPPDNTESLTLWWPKVICPGPDHMLTVRAITPM